ncbi:ras-related and estrogen-regulated growth inhibitor-like [Centruroides vittatus]|uniref:ras-related and estrogen-regulated growth inhibitor-like n=1 Tax=Centruroides vittatus TaxID=120091 RepID=UPI00350EDEA8
MERKNRMAFLRLGQSLTEDRREVYKVAVLGAENVGKTALIVRFLTNKYLSEYSHCGNATYERNITIDGRVIAINVFDASGKETFIGLKRHGMLEGIEGYVVVYSIVDKRSFFKARELLRTIQIIDKRAAIALIGNKEDLIHLRTVSGNEGYKEGIKYSRCTFHECSAAKEAENVKIAFQTFFRQVIQSKEDRQQYYSNNNNNNFPQPNVRRNTISNFTLSTWLRRSRFASTNTKTIKNPRTFTM